MSDQAPLFSFGCPSSLPYLRSRRAGGHLCPARRAQARCHCSTLVRYELNLIQTSPDRVLASLSMRCKLSHRCLLPTSRNVRTGIRNSPFASHVIPSEAKIPGGALVIRSRIASSAASPEWPSSHQRLTVRPSGSSRKRISQSLMSRPLARNMSFHRVAGYRALHCRRSTRQYQNSRQE